MVTIKDIAKAVGVSTATVSHVINETRFVSEPLRIKVNAVIEDLGYQPNISIDEGLRRTAAWYRNEGYL